MITIAIVDDNPHVANDIKKILSLNAQFTILFTAYNGIELLDKLQIAEELPQLIIMDIQMPKLNGIETVRLVKQNYPSIKILMHTISEDDNDIIEAIKLGANGYLLKNEKPLQFIENVLDTLNGGVPIHPSMAHKLINYFTTAAHSKPTASNALPNLSDREIDVLNLIAQGFSYKIVADKLSINVKTVGKHLENIYVKLQVHNKTEAINKFKKQV
ncbi:MAG: response regulator transcription factor [Bacteroidia bacterium]